MTILEALNIEVNNSALASKYLVLQGLTITDEFSTSNSNDVEIAKAYIFRSLITNPDFSEDGLSITQNRASLIAEANRIFLANGLENEVIGKNPIIKNISGQW